VPRRDESDPRPRGNWPRRIAANSLIPRAPHTIGRFASCSCYYYYYYYYASAAGSILCVPDRNSARKNTAVHAVVPRGVLRRHFRRASDVPRKLITRRSKKYIFHKKINFKRNVSQLFLVPLPRRWFNYTVHRFGLLGGPESGEFKYCYSPRKIIIIITISNGPYNCIYYRYYFCARIINYDSGSNSSPANVQNDLRRNQVVRILLLFHSFVPH